MENKKHSDVDFRGKRPAFLLLGLIVSLSMVFSAFEWKTMHTPNKLVVCYLPFPQEDEPPITIHKDPLPPPPPPSEAFEIIETALEPAQPEDLIDIFPESNELINETPPIIISQPDEPTDDIFMIVEEQASFSKDKAAWSKFLRKHLKYPRQAQRVGVEGRVFLSFIVDKNGSLSNIRVERGIGAGCDQEAIRVLKKSPKWTPGKQRGHAVNSRMAIQIQFKLK